MATKGLGQLIQEVRKRRGLTQRELAQLSGVSLSLLRKLEQGERADTRVETLRRLAVAMRVPTSSLMDRPEADDAPAELAVQWVPVHNALLGLGFEQLEEAPSLVGVEAAVRAAEPLFTKNRYADLGALLPSLLRDADALGTEGRQVRTRALHLAGLLMVQTRQFDTADMALTRALDDSQDRLDAAAAINTQCWLLVRQGKIQPSLDLATRWADDIEPRFSRATLPELSTWGGLMLRVSTAAVRNNQPGDAEDALKLAQAAGARMGMEYASPSDFARTFGPVKVAMRQAENAMIEDRPDRVLKLAEGISRDGFRSKSSSVNRHRLDVANAHAHLRQYGEAFALLEEIRRLAPEWIVNQRLARDVLRRITSRRRTLTPAMRNMADFIHLEY